MTLISPSDTAISTSAQTELQRVAVWITDCRRRSSQPFEPWPQPETGPSDWPLAELLHHSEPHRLWRPRDLGQPTDLLDELTVIGLLSHKSNGYGPGPWQLTAAGGLYAVRDRPTNGPPRVFLSDDGLRLLDTVLSSRPAGRVLDVGCGAGLATAAAALTADHVHGIDLVPDCLDATRRSTHLSDLSHNVTVEHADLTTYQPDKPVDCIIANLPGVPVPPSLDYPPAGNGGPDGLALTTRLLETTPHWLTTTARHEPQNPVLLMRLQGPGDPHGPYALELLHQLARTAHLDISVITDSRIDRRVRDGLTTSYAHRHNPHLDHNALAQTVQAHSHQLGMTHYYSSSVIAHPADNGQLHHLDLAPRDWLNQPLHTRPVAVDLVPEITAQYYTRLARLPVGFWELGTHHTITAPARRISELIELLNQHATGANAVTALFTNELAESPLEALPLYTTTNLLIETIQTSLSKGTA